MNLIELQFKTEAVEAPLKSVGNRNRLIVLCELSKGERSVGSLQQALGVSQSALSQHLARLRLDGVVQTGRKSQTVLLCGVRRAERFAKRKTKTTS
jgi:ArsR family transcriptional regulator